MKFAPFLLFFCAFFGCTYPPNNAPTVIIDKHVLSDYGKFIEIKNLRTERSITGNDGIFGEIKNTGSKTITRLTVRAILLDKNGAAISEKDFPVIFQGISELEDFAPLKPNYSRKFGFTVDAPSDWAKTFRLSIIAIETE